MVVEHTSKDPQAVNISNVLMRYSHLFKKAVKTNTPGATIVPVLISLDKTQLTDFGGKMAYPVYLTIENLPK
jgi:hypothetical protein